MAPEMAAVASTPSPPPEGIRTPPAPRLGYHDHWEPYSPRKSARISSQLSANRTPSPNSSQHRRHATPRTSKKANSRSNAAMVSPVPSPRKKRQPPVDTSRRVSGSLTAEGTANAAAALGLGEPAPSSDPTSSSSSHNPSGMLPTPSKTPSKPQYSKQPANVESFARNLFSSDDQSGIKKRRAKKYTGMTMDSFTVEEQEDSIPIFTDSQERIPNKDSTSTNPFYGNGSKDLDVNQRRSRRRQINIPGEGAQSVDDATRREDGMIYVFRGKKFFRKFSELDEDAVDESQRVADAEAHLAQPLTRSSVKPRLLFPPKESEVNIDDEEATTDVEDNVRNRSEPMPETPRKTREKYVDTPEAPKYAPVSPPDTKRTTRSTNKLSEDETPVKPTRRRSVFDSWKRTKEHKATVPAKRTGDSLAQSSTKRTRA